LVFGTLLKKERDVDVLLRYDEKGLFPKTWQKLGPWYNQ
jgi:hypothetical protein